MKTFYSIALILLLIISCSDNDLVSVEDDKRQPFVIHPTNYSKRHYFIDSAYNDSIFFNYYNNDPPIISNYYRIKEIQVWRTNYGNKEPGEEIVYLYSNLPPIQKLESYSSSYRVNDKRAIPLIEGEDYIINRYTGIVSLMNSISEIEELALSYKIEGESLGDEDDLIYGEFINESNTSYVLKMFKAQNSYSMGSLWYLQLKNIYYVGEKNISEKDFTFDIYIVDKKNNPVNSFSNNKLLQAFGLDSNGDGKFDFIKDKTIIPETGDIIFPSLEPFGANIPDIFTYTYNDTLYSPYNINSIYWELPYKAESDTNASKFYFYGRYFTK